MISRLLIISGTAVRNDTNIGKTICSLFSNIDKYDKYHLYFSPENPNINIFRSNYHFYEKDNINKFFGLFNDCGEENESLSKEIITNNEKIIKNKNNICIKGLRELIWKITYWKNKKFKRWIDNISPNVIFLFYQDTIFSLKIAKWISKRFNCPIILYVTDDYYHDFGNSKNVLRQIFYKCKHRSLIDLKSNIVKVIGCSNEAASFFGNLCEKSFVTLYTPVDKKYLDLPFHRQRNRIIIFRYFGNLGLKRWEILECLGKTIKEINAGKEMAILEIYSSCNDQNIINKLNIKNGSTYKGWANPQKCLYLLEDTDIAVHVESFDFNTMQRTKMSISTKIPDYLGAGKCILAIGEKNLASISHINGIGEIVSDIKDLENVVRKLIDDINLRTNYQILSRDYAIKNHQNEKISLMMETILDDVKKQ